MLATIHASGFEGIQMLATVHRRYLEGIQILATIHAQGFDGFWMLSIARGGNSLSFWMLLTPPAQAPAGRLPARYVPLTRPLPLERRQTAIGSSVQPHEKHPKKLDEANTQPNLGGGAGGGGLRSATAALDTVIPTHQTAGANARSGP